MAVGNLPWKDLPVVDGLRLGVAKAGIKHADRYDLGIILVDEGAHVAGVFTQNAFAAAPVSVCRQHLSENCSTIRALIVNSGNANACTGREGLEAALETCRRVAEHISIDLSCVLPFSTGVIGEPLPLQNIVSALPQVVESADKNAWHDFALSIMTTDTRPKGASASFEWQGQPITVSGVAKGAGMINPDMATMLAFVATDAKIEEEILQDMCAKAAKKSFNRITIDGDTSTNDACVLIATGKHNTALTDDADPLYAPMLAAVVDVFQSLAQQIVRDGEGATKFVEIVVGGGGSAQESLDVAYAIAHSPLVKTAMFASDPNWGRIVAAIGYADVEALDASRVKVWLDDVLIVADGGRAESYREDNGQRVVDQDSFTIRVDLGRGVCEESLWTSDLSHEYVRINAEYRS